MPIKIGALLALACIAGADEPSPITDRMRYELAAAQRDYLVAKQTYDQAVTTLKAKIDSAEKACAALDKHFSVESFDCAGK